MLVGLTVPSGGVSTWQSWEAEVGKLYVRHTYNSGDLPSTYANSACSIDPQLNVASAYLCKPNLTSVANGDYDSRFIAFAQSVPAGQKLWIGLWGEAERYIEQGTFTLSTYNAAMQRFGAAIQAAGNSNVKSVVNSMAYTWNPASGRTPDNYLPAFQAVDAIMLDGYGQTKLTPFSQVFANATTYLQTTHNFTVGVWETSTQDDANDSTHKPQWISNAMDWAFQHNYAHFIGYMGTVGGASPILNTSLDQQAFATKNATYVEGGGTTPPPVEPPPVDTVLAPLQGTYLVTRW